MFSYFPKRFLMNRNERRFYKKLESAFEDNYRIFPQVHLDELVKPKDSTSPKNYLFSFRHINQKSVDFVLCDKNSLQPRVAIELDGESHYNQQTKNRDSEVERILKEIDLPLVRFTNNEIDMSPEEIKSHTRERVALSQTVPFTQ